MVAAISASMDVDATVVYLVFGIIIGIIVGAIGATVLATYLISGDEWPTDHE